MMTVRRMPTNPPRLCLVEVLPGGTQRHDRLAIWMADARRIAHELLDAVNEYEAEIARTGGVPPTIGG